MVGATVIVVVVGRTVVVVVVVVVVVATRSYAKMTQASKPAASSLSRGDIAASTDDCEA